MKHLNRSTAFTSVTCPLCESDEHQTLATRGRSGEDLHTVICTGCGLVFTSPIPTPEEVAEYYAIDYRLSYKGVVQPKLKHIYRSGQRALTYLPWLEKYCPPGGRVLDIGSSGGEFLYLLKTLGYEASGIEPDKGYGGFSIQEYGLDVQIGPFQNSMIQPESFDLITANHVVEHLRDPLSVFRGVHAGLKPGGYFVVEVPNVECIGHTPSNKWHFAHIFNFNSATLENFGLKAGFEVTSTDFNSRGRNIRTTFRKTDQYRPIHPLHENYHRVKETLDSYTDWDHFTSLIPAKHLLQMAVQTVYEKIAVNHSYRGKQILDELYSLRLADYYQRAAA